MLQGIVQERLAISWVQFNKNHTGLAQQFWVNPLSCENPAHYENYIRYIAITDRKSGKGFTHLIIDTDEANSYNKIVGFVTLRTSSLIMTEYNSVIGRSAIEITELAIDKDYERKGFGRQLIDLALSVTDEVRQNYAGVEFLVAVADPASEAFYIRQEFEKLADYYEIPRENWNVNCIPMLLRFPEL